MAQAAILITPTSPDDLALRKMYRKISWRLLPFLLLCYVLA